METTDRHFRKRDAILSCLRQTKLHPSAESLHRMLRAEHPDISLATVYRNLALFKSQGLIMSLGTVDGIERFDGNTEPHVHLVCRCCGGVQDLPSTGADRLCAETARESGCRIDGFQLIFSGLCRSCLENGKN